MHIISSEQTCFQNQALTVSTAKDDFQPVLAYLPYEYREQRLNTEQIGWGDCGFSNFSSMRLGWAQIVGKFHQGQSEDSVGYRVLEKGCNNQILTMALADGVGGGAHAKQASQILIEHLISEPIDEVNKIDRIKKLVESSEQRVKNHLTQMSRMPGASTVSALWVYGNQHPSKEWHCFATRVGDARAYWFDGQALFQLLEDQTYKNTQEIPPPGSFFDDPSRMVGSGYIGDIEVKPFNLQSGQALMLCSDGLHKSVSRQNLQDNLAQAINYKEGVEGLAKKLCMMARYNGSKDDISIQILMV